MGCYITYIKWFFAAGIGFSTIELLNENSGNFKLSPFFVTLVAFCFSMTIGVLWEFFEYNADNYLKWDMQKDTLLSSVSSMELIKDNNKVFTIDNIESVKIFSKDKVITVDGGYLDIGLKDTMEDLYVNFIGALVFSLIGFLYINNRDKYKFASNFIVVKQNNKNLK